MAMSVTLRWSGALAVVLAAVGSPVLAQNGLPGLMPGAGATGFGGNVGVLGNSVAPAIAPLMNAAAANPYALSTVPSFNPYMSPMASMGNNGGGYGMSTYPGGYGGLGYGTVLPGGYAGALFGEGYMLQGFASTITATGQYEKDIMKARIIREQARQMELETAKKALQFQWWYENQLLHSSSRLRDAEAALSLDRARKDPPESEIYSANTLNTLLRSINNASKLSRGPNVPLDEDRLKHINLSGGTSPGNIGMLKDASKVDWKPDWPEALLGDGLDEARANLTKELRSAVNTLRDKAELTRANRNNIRAAYDALLKALNETDYDLTPSQSIEARKFMNQMASAIKALSDPKATNYFNNTWNAKGRNVAELVEHMNREGLRFAPAAPGDEASYRAMYQALRAFEVGLQTATAQR